ELPIAEVTEERVVDENLKVLKRSEVNLNTAKKTEYERDIITNKTEYNTTSIKQEHDVEKKKEETSI
ncbi:hypothetical protein ACFLSE_02005, partial [Bacteroidota bacterium]